jgi:hypothetical protein
LLNGTFHMIPRRMSSVAWSRMSRAVDAVIAESNPGRHRSAAPQGSKKPLTPQGSSRAA